MNERMKNIYHLTRYGTEITIQIPTSIFHEENTNFKEQQEALKELKKDPQLAIFEENNKLEEKMINGVKVESHYTILTIRRLDK